MYSVASLSSSVFLSTLSLRRATGVKGLLRKATLISIHALLAESDDLKEQEQPDVNISIHALLAESDTQTAPGYSAT